MMKNKQDNDVTYRIGMVYSKTKIELLGTIWLSVVCHENQTWQQHDPLYKYGPHWKWNWVVWLIKLDAFCVKNQIGQWHDWSYKFALL